MRRNAVCDISTDAPRGYGMQTCFVVRGWREVGKKLIFPPSRLSGLASQSPVFMRRGRERTSGGLMSETVE